MSNDRHFNDPSALHRRHPPDGLSSSWDYVSPPPSSSHFPPQVSRSSADLDDSLEDPDDLTNPDDFYRLYSPPPHGPSQNSQFSELSENDDMTTATSRQRQGQTNGVPAGKVGQTPRTARPGFRSASQPTSGPNPPPGSNVDAAFPGGSRAQVKNLVNRFNQSGAIATPENTARHQRASLAARASATAARSAAEARSPGEPDAASNKLFKPRTRDKYPKALGPITVEQRLTRRPVGSPGKQTSFGDSVSPTQSRIPTSSQRPLLFGEINAGGDNTPDLGYGIPPSGESRRGSEGSVQVSGATFAHSRSQSDMESSYYSVTQSSRNDPATGQRSEMPAGHHRAQSDLSGIAAAEHKGLGKATLSGPFNVPAIAETKGRRRRSPPSKIPVRSRRGSSNSDSGSSRRPSQDESHVDKELYSSPPPVSPRQQKKPTGLRKRNVTPPDLLPTLYYRPDAERNSPRGNASLKALIHAPLPKTSPPLRTSRSRQPLPMATTASSRAKMREPISPLSSRDVTRTNRASSEEPRARLRKEVGLRSPNLAIHKGLFERTSQENLKKAGGQIGRLTKANPAAAKSSSAQNLQQKNRYSLDSSDIEDESSDIQVDDEPVGPAAGGLTVQTNGLPKRDSSEPLTGQTEFENDESPITGLPGRFPSPELTGSSNPSVEPTPVARQEPIAVNDPSARARDADAHPSPAQDNTLLSHVMAIRRRSPSNASHAGTDFAEDMLSEFGDAESIQIMLGSPPSATPAKDPWLRPDSETYQEHFHVAGEPVQIHKPVAAGIAFVDDGDESPIDPFESSIQRGGLANVVWHKRQDTNATITLSPKQSEPRETSRYTLDIEAYNAINRILDQYRKSIYVSPEMAGQSKEQVYAISPDLARHDAWESRVATVSYLEYLLTDRVELEDSNTPKPLYQTHSRQNSLRPVLTINPNESPEPGYTGTAIIYSQDDRYGGDSESADHDDRSGTDKEYRPTPPPKDWSMFAPGNEIPSLDEIQASMGQFDELTPLEENQLRAESLKLPEIRGAGEGLGIAIHVDSAKQSRELSPPPTGDSLHRHTSLRNAERAEQARNYTRSPPTPGVFGKPQISPRRIPGVDGSNRSRSVSGEDEERLPETQPRSSETSLRPSLGQQSTLVGDVSPEFQKRLQKRRHIIRELVDTELKYGQDMKVVEDIYKGAASSNEILSQDDRKVLFGNSAEIVEFSLTFLDALKAAASSVYVLPREKRWNAKRGSFSTSHSTLTDQSSVNSSEVVDDSQDKKTLIGAAFNKHTARMEKIYGEYLKNHDAANQRLKVLQEKPKVKSWLVECQKWADDITSAWNLDSLLVKPTQRILKYPLLLQQLLECTPKDHPDHAAIDAALKELTSISLRINEAKKRAELMDQVVNRKRKESDGRLPSGLAKAFGRRTEKLKQQVGLTETVDDQDYDAIAQKFGGHFFQLQIVMRDVEKYLEEVQLFADQCSAFFQSVETLIEVNSNSSPEIESKWLKYARIFREMITTALPEHKAALRKSVIEPIMTLWKLHESPQKMMQKRKKRIVEYARFKGLKERGEKPDKRTQEAGEQWIALNETLKIELPKLYSLTKKLVEACLINFVEIQVTWQDIWQRKMAGAIEQPREWKHFSQDLSDVMTEFQGDFDVTETQVLSLGICNRALISETTNFLSPSSGMVGDDASFRRPGLSDGRAQSVSSEQSSINSDARRRQSGQVPPLPYLDSSTSHDGFVIPSPRGRQRANSNLSNRGPPTPKSAPNTAGLPPQQPQTSRPSTSQGRNPEGSHPMSRQSSEITQPLPSLGPPTIPMHQTASNHRSSTIFSSAMPMPDSPSGTRSHTPEDNSDENPEVLFLAASLFEFNIAHDRREGGIPYLVYVPGEIFDVIGQKGELWLARNQDDPSHKVGWIWEKHFARILPDEG